MSDLRSTTKNFLIFQQVGLAANVAPGQPDGAIISTPDKIPAPLWQQISGP